MVLYLVSTEPNHKRILEVTGNLKLSFNVYSTMITEVTGDLIKLSLEGEFDVIAHGCNCFCNMGAGIAPQMAKTFGADRFRLERPSYEGDHNKLGQIDWDDTMRPTVVNAYTQYGYGRSKGIPLDYEALTLCMRKINYQFKGKHIGLPRIGCGLAGGDWKRVKQIISTELKDCRVTIVTLPF